MKGFSHLNAGIRAKHAALFAKAEALSARMGSAIALNTCHARYLRRLRTGLRHQIACYNPAMLRTWIGEFEAAIDSECRAALATLPNRAVTLPMEEAA